MAGKAAGRGRVARLSLGVLGLSPLLLAAKSTPDPAQSLAGRYYRQFPNALVSGEKYVGEDIVEIVPVRTGAAYVRIHLDYYNGHSCTIFGVARAVGASLVYRDPSPTYDGRPCTLAVKRVGGSLSIDDGDWTCHTSHCGMRGSLNDVSLPYSSKRPIRYLARLKASDQYRWALDEWRTGTPMEEQWNKDHPPEPKRPDCEVSDGCAM